MKRDGGVSRIVTFARPFKMPGLAAEQPAGDYVVETDDPPRDGASGARQAGTWIRLPLPWGAAGSPRRVPIDPAALEEALMRDRMPVADGTIAQPREPDRA